MKRAVFLPLLLATLVLIWSGADLSLAYYPPLQNITGPTVVQDTETKVTVSVHNPATGEDIPYTWTIPGGAFAYAVDQLSNYQGMVAWRVKDLSNNKFQIVTGVYDPNPAMGWQISTNWGAWLAHETNILAVNDGVVLYESKYTPETPSVENPSVIVDYFATYDPALEMPGHPWFVGWRSTSYSFTDYSGGNTYGHVVKDGVVAYIYYSPAWDYELIYGIFDSRLHFWSTGNHTSVPVISALSINAATVSYRIEPNSFSQGYDYTDTTWKQGQSTKVMANFAFAPLEPKPNQFIYFTDMSIGANAWIWMTGDGFTTGDRSFSHKYVKPGQYAAKQDVTGPAGFDTISQTVPVKASSLTGPLLLLLSD